MEFSRSLFALLNESRSQDHHHYISSSGDRIMNQSELDSGFLLQHLSPQQPQTQHHYHHHHHAHVHERADLTSVWILSLLCSTLVGCTGLLPFFVLPKQLSSCESANLLYL